MSLQNRVDPFGQLFADASRGSFMGNRGGRIHRDDRTLSSRRWASRQWICCRLAFKNRHRKVWGKSYTELFFLDEVTAFAAGHRPCFECRRQDADAFAELWPRKREKAHPRAVEMDLALHAQRLDGRHKRRHRLAIDTLPDGACIVMDGVQGQPCMLRGEKLLRWMPNGYVPAGSRPRAREIDVLTPPAILAVLTAGYRPLWHPSADALSV